MIPIFTTGCITTNVTGLQGRGLTYIRNAMTAKPDGYQFMPSFKRGHWDGNICLLHDNEFPTGLLFLATGELKEADLPYEIVDIQPDIHTQLDLDLAGYDLRDYQIESIQAALEYRRGILKLATNAGKTLVTAGIIKSTGSNAAVVVPSKPLLHQTADYYAKVLGLPIGKVGDGLEQMDAPIVVSTMASFYKVAAYSEKRPFNTLILDEVHHAKAKSIFEAAKFLEAPIRIGVSGTPLTYSRLDDLNLMGTTGPLLYEITNADLIERGFSVKPIIVFHEIDRPEIPKKAAYNDAYDILIVHNRYRNSLIHEIVVDSPGLTLILVERLEHVENLLQAIPGAIPATGSTDNQEILAGMRQGKYKAVVATNVFGEGVDVEGIDSIVLAGAGHSHIRLLQRIGRGLRFKEGKATVTIHDFIDSGSKYLLNQSEERLSTYDAEGFSVILSD